MTNTVRVSLKVLGFEEEPEVITRQIGLQPTKTWRQGELIPGTIRPRAASGWEIAAREEGGTELEPQIELLFSRLKGKEAVIYDIASRARVELSVVVYARESVPALHLPREAVEYLGRLQCAVDIDLYCLIEDGEDGH